MRRAKKIQLYDKWLLLSVCLLIGIGILMVSSTSTVIADQQYHSPFHYLNRQLVYVVLGITVAFIIVKIPSQYWVRLSPYLFLVVLALLIAVLIPGLGHSVNGSRRWLGVGPFMFQVSEVAKFSFILYLAGYLVRRQAIVQTQITGFLIPIVLLGIVGLLLLAEPDFGATVVMSATTLGLLFLAGVRLSFFVTLVCGMGALLGLIAISSPYRMARLTSFLNPWANQFDGGYQLTQSLIAFGRGGWFGTGIGNSIQKLFYLPEAHTDFLFAVLTEELGLIGAFSVMVLFGILVYRAIKIGHNAWQLQRPMQAYMGYGFGLWIGLQAMINLGVNMGLLPTKGLTLPFISYGGTSMLVNCALAAILLRIDYENRVTYQHVGH